MAAIGILDIGTLSLRFDVFNFDLKNPTSLASFRLIHRAGEHDMESDEEVEGLVIQFRETFDEVTKIANDHGANRIIGGATGFFRNHTSFSDRILAEAKRHKIELAVLTGEQESQLIAEAVIKFYPHLPHSALLVDIGGGSTEVSVVCEKKMLRNTSVPMGVLVAKRRYPPDAEGRFSSNSLAALDADIEELFSEVAKKFAIPAACSPEIVIGSSGSARELERILAPGGGVLSLNQLEDFFAPLKVKSLAELAKVEELDQKRIDLLIPGTAIFIGVMKAFGLNETRVSHFSLRHGILAAVASRTIWPDNSRV